jgi:hypothetical protein
MRDPIKIIWKYKNKNRKQQYQVYIFVGNVKKNILEILDKIKDLSLYNTLIKLSKQEYQTLEEMYGEKWYIKFFNSFHTISTINLIKETQIQEKEILNKYGKEWFDKHINKFDMADKRIIYNYESVVNTEKLKKLNQKKLREYQIEKTKDLFENNFKTIKKEDIIDILGIKKFATISDKNRYVESDITTSNTTINTTSNITTQEESNITSIKNQDTSELDLSTTTSDMSDESDINQEGGDIGDDEEVEELETVVLEQGETIDEEEELDMEQIEELYKNIDVEPDKNINKTSELIAKALKDEKIFDKKDSNLIDFDQSKDNTIYEENLKDVYSKIYVKQYYLYKDDTIKNIKNKICGSMLNNSIFNNNPYITPSRIYLWSQYYFDNNLQKVMIGQKWMRKNELLNLDIEPNNNIYTYEELRGNLKSLRDNLKRFGSKIRREDDENNILYDYDGYYTNNELFMIDIYNELGRNYNPEPQSLKNITDLYLKVYFNNIKSDEIKNILTYLNKNTKIDADNKEEEENNKEIFANITNDLVMETEITNVVEEVKTSNKYKKIFGENYNIGSVIHLNLKQINNNPKVDLYRIFNDFETNEDYPFIQYQTPDGQIVFKLNEKEIDKYIKNPEYVDIVSKWFENAPYGISFKVKYIENDKIRFIAINLTENGRVEYKTQWKEEDKAGMGDIKESYKLIRKLVKIINEGDNNTRFIQPDDLDFKFAFINSIQKFNFPDDYIINHNDLSEFSRYFYPYISLVRDPRKRTAKDGKESEVSKFGTYLRYKRVSKYDNSKKIEYRILYFMRNFEFNEKILINEIAKQFNITEEKAEEEINKVKNKYPNLRKSRKVLKKIENLPKFKPPGIDISIQGKQKDKYKIRISGARDNEQLYRILDFMNILLFLYYETYLEKKKERQILKEKLKNLNNIAKRRNKVEEIVDYDKEVKNIKQMASKDKYRLGYRPEKGQNQWSRNCQNSGDMKRQPQQYSTVNVEDLLKQGYILNNKTGLYERKVRVKNKMGQNYDTLLKTVKVKELDENGIATGNEIHYACDPKENGQYFYVGFLTKSRNPFGQCMPCCFKKPQEISKNKTKRNFYLKCIGETVETEYVEKKEKGSNIYDKLYILQDTNKISDGKIGSLPSSLDYYFNYMMGKTKKIKSHYLISAPYGYYFKMGSKQSEHNFLNAIAACLDITFEEMRDKIIKALEDDKSNNIFISLNNGDLATQFITKDNYINYLKYNKNLEYEYTHSILNVPGVINKNGINVVIFRKDYIKIRKALEKEKIKEDFYLICPNKEDMTSITEPEKTSIILIKENRNYNPIIMALKSDKSKNIEIFKNYKYEETKDNVIKYILPFYMKNCEDIMREISINNYSLTARMTYNILMEIGGNYKPRLQYVDVRNKCRYIITNNNLLVPVMASGSIYNLQIVKTIEKYIDTYDNTMDKLNELYKKSDNKLPIKPIGVYFDKRDENNFKINSIMTQTKDIIPITLIQKNISEIKKEGLIYEGRPLYDKIDQDIVEGKTTKKVDNRILEVNEMEYKNEAYELFRFEFSDFINKSSNKDYRDKLLSIIENKKLSKEDKENKIKLFLYKITDKELYKIYRDTIYRAQKENISDVNILGGNKENNPESQPEEEKEELSKKLLRVSSKQIDFSKYNLSNERALCSINKNENKCSANSHCYWYQDECYFTLTKEMLSSFVNKITYELVSYEIKAFELLQIENYRVQDIINTNLYKEYPNEKIIRTTNTTIKKVLTELFGEQNIPQIGRRKKLIVTEIDYKDLNLNNPLKELKEYYAQLVIPNNMTILRTYVNIFYWNKYKLNDVTSRNLGYYNPQQTDISNYFKSLIIEWILDKKNYNVIEPLLKEKEIDNKKSRYDFIDDFIILISDPQNIINKHIILIILFILNKIHKIPIIVYDDDNKIRYILDNKYLINPKPNEYQEYINNLNKILVLRMNFITNKYIPDELEALYYK